MKSIIIIIMITGMMSPLAAQQLASQKPVTSYYSKTTKQKLESSSKDRQPAALKARQELPSQQAVQQPSVPGHIQPARKEKRVNAKKQLASEKAIDMDKINRQRRKTQ